MKKKLVVGGIIVALLVGWFALGHVANGGCSGPANNAVPTVTGGLPTSPIHAPYKLIQQGNVSYIAKTLSVGELSCS